MNIREKIKNRINNRKGASIGELLTCVLILLLATSVVTSTVTVAVNNYKRELSVSEANVLASTLESLMTSELAYTTEIQLENDGTTVKEFQSQNYTAEKSLSMFAVEKGKMMVTFPDDSSVKSVKLLGDETAKGGKGAYPNGLTVSMEQFTYDKTTHCFTIQISIKRNNETILTRTFNVINVNNTEPPN